MSACCLVVAPAFGGDWVTYNYETSTRMVSNPSVGAADTQEKDYAWGDVDHDGWTDLIVVRKQPFTVGTQGRSNVLFMNLNGVLTDQTAQWMPDFLDEIEDRDVALVDVDNDGWDDIVTAAACNNQCNPGGISDDSRLYMNLGNDGGGNWLGYDSGIVLIGTLGNNFCAVAAGDINNDGYADLYFVSYNDSFEDQLMMNGGPENPGVFTIENNRLTSAMRASGFGTNAIIVDMNGDGWAEIVKSENGPVEIFRNNQNGFFDLLDPTYGGAAYHVGVGDLDGNGLMDLVLSDDGTDRYILNPVLDGAADTSFAFPNSTGGFGSNSVIVDLDGDGFNEVLIADCDVDVNTRGSQDADILRNSPGPVFTADSANIPNSMLGGTHDIAVFDINNDGQLDIILGRCTGTQIWINSQTVIAISFEYPGGLPQFITPDETTKLVIEINAVGDTL
ncbi:MAG: VCBS repeat-containing protein, partial [Phycisphaerales bacterium]